MRCFIAIPMPDITANSLAQLQQGLTTGRPFPRDNLHLTLAFLDDQPDEVLETLHQELQGIRQKPFAIGLSGLGQFGKSVHVAVNASADLTALYDRIGGALRRARVILPRRRFRPHVTIARQSTLGAFVAGCAGRGAEDLRVPVDRFALMASTLHPDGARHQCLAAYACTSQF